MSSPDVLSFTDYRAYLRAVLPRASRERGGLRELARESGLRSAGMLSMAAHGKRNLSPATAEKLAGVLGLASVRRDYFVTLARLATARAEEEKLALRERLVTLRGHRDERKMTASQLRFLSRWHYSAIYAMLDSPRFRREPAWIAKKLGRGISVEDVKRAIGDLISLGLVREKDGKLVPTETAIATPDEVRDVAVRRYHENTLQLAKEALALDLSEREAGGLTLSLSAEHLPRLRERIRRFRKELNEEFGTAYGADRVYQLCLHLFPLTAPLGEEPA